MLAEDPRPVRQQIFGRELRRAGGGIEHGEVALGMHQRADHGGLPTGDLEQLLEAKTHTGANHAKSDQMTKLAKAPVPEVEQTQRGQGKDRLQPFTVQPVKGVALPKPCAVPASGLGEALR